MYGKVKSTIEAVKHTLLSVKTDTIARFIVLFFEKHA